MDEGSRSLVAVEAECKSNISDGLSAQSRNCKDRRSLKLQYKNINRMCLEMDIARGKRKPIAGINESQKILGNFCIVVYDLQTEFMYQLKDQDQMVIREQLNQVNKGSSATLDTSAAQEKTFNCSSPESVDSIRFLKTNGAFYQRAIIIWLKFL